MTTSQPINPRNLSPIALFTYTRPEHTRRTVEALAANDGAQDSELFIFSDAPKSLAAEPAVAAVRTYLRTITGFKRIEIIERPHNFGLADSIVDGVTSMVQRYGRVIVLEDDIVTSRHFLSYMNEALALYEHDPQVMHVSGLFFPVDISNLPETFFYAQASCWGWGTWERAWKAYQPDAEKLLREIKEAGRLDEFDMDGNFRFSSTLRANIAGTQKTWAVKWQASIFLQHGLCLHPRLSLVRNIGNDGSGVHAGTTKAFNLIKISGVPITVTRIPLQESPQARKAAISFLRLTRPGLIEKILNKISNLFSVPAEGKK